MKKALFIAPEHYMVQLDGLRFLAVLLVMIGHWFDFSIPIKLLLGTSGVNLFFVLSGFLISVILMSNKDSGMRPRLLLIRFYIRRFLRIFPLYYLVIIIGVIINLDGVRDHFIWLVSYTVNYILALGNGYGGGRITHLWSLAVEEQFYLIFPFLIFMTPKQRYLKLFYALIALAIISRFIIYFTLPDKAFWISYAFTPCCFDSFAIGGLLAYLYLYDRYRLKSILEHKLFFLIMLIVYFICSYCNFFQVTRTVFSIISFWVVGVAAMGQYRGIMKMYLENKAVVYLGRITYGLYVYHFIVPWIFSSIGIGGHRYNTMLYFIATVIIASLSWYFFENPLNNLKKYFEYKKEGIKQEELKQLQRVQ